MKSGANWVSLPVVTAAVTTTTNTCQGLPGTSGSNTTTCSTCSSPRMSARVLERERDDAQHRRKRKRIEEEDAQPMCKRRKEDTRSMRKRKREVEDGHFVVKRRKLDQDPVRRGKKRRSTVVDDDYSHPVNKRRKCIDENAVVPSVGAAFAGVGLDNSAFQLMWSNVHIRLNEELISQQNSTYGLQAAIFNNLFYQDDYRKSRAQLAGSELCVFACFCVFLHVFAYFCIMCA